jgi:hypothetical protein
MRRTAGKQQVIRKTVDALGFIPANDSTTSPSPATLTLLINILPMPDPVRSSVDNIGQTLVSDTYALQAAVVVFRYVLLLYPDF